jgi:3',5'-cyclic AMP phosphodiesterase CpdA
MFMPGNHDSRRPFRRHLIDWEENDEVIDQVRWIDGLRVIGLDSTALGGHWGEVTDEQLAWLAEELQTPAPLGTILALHHPPIPGPIEPLNVLIVADPERLAEVIRGTDVRLVVAGHTHHAQTGMLGGVPVSVATASAYQMDVLSAGTVMRGLPGVAFTRIDVSPDMLHTTYVQLLPTTPRLYEIELEKLAGLIAGHADQHEVESAFAPAVVEA